MRLRRLLPVALAVLAAAGGFIYHALNQRHAGFRGEVLAEIRGGTSTREMGRILERHGVVRHELLFLAVRVLRREDKLHAGEYKFDRPASPWEVFDRIARGDVFYYKLRVPEGSNIFDIARIVGEMGFVDAEEFLAAARKPAMIRDLAPEAAMLEGYLFPSTYYVTRQTTAVEICRMMTGQFRKVWRELAPAVETHDAVTLASLVEKETGVSEERPLVASVFHNRLRKGIKLECDPTIVYAAILAGDYRGVIHRSDLDRQHPYSTYLNTGLPPGPIANPGRESLRATLEPAETDYLFFVATPDGSGEHVFSKTLAAHNRAVRSYRRGIKKTARKEQSE